MSAGTATVRERTDSLNPLRKTRSSGHWFPWLRTSLPFPVMDGTSLAGAIDRDYNVPGTRLPECRPKLRQYVDASLKQAPFEMDADQRDVVVKAMSEVCRFKHWRLHAAQVRSNHVHAVVDA